MHKLNFSQLCQTDTEALFRQLTEEIGISNTILPLYILQNISLKPCTQYVVKGCKPWFMATCFPTLLHMVPSCKDI